MYCTREKIGGIEGKLGWVNFATLRGDTGSLVTSPTYGFPRALWDPVSLLPDLRILQAFARPAADGEVEAGMASTYLLPLDKSHPEP